jgi:membrane protein
MTTAVPLAASSSIKDVALAVKDRIKLHQLPIIAAGIAFWGFLALIPFLTGLISLTSLVADPDEVVQQLDDADLPSSIDGMVRDPLEAAQADAAATAESGESGGDAARIAGTALGIALALWAASGGIKHLMGALNIAYDEVESRKFVPLRGTALLLTLGAILVVGAIGFSVGAVPTMVAESSLPSAAKVAVEIGKFAVVIGLLVLALTVLYTLGPDHKLKRSGFWRGAVVATIVLLPGLIVVSLFADVITGGSFGALGAIALAMVVFLLASAATIIGAEWNRASESPGGVRLDGTPVDIDLDAQAGLAGAGAGAGSGTDTVEDGLGNQGKILGLVMAGAAIGAAALESFKGDSDS